MKSPTWCVRSALVLLLSLAASGCTSIESDTPLQTLPEVLHLSGGVTLAGAIDNIPESGLRRNDTLVIDLRGAEEEGVAEQSSRLSSAGIRHVSFPVGREIPTPEQVLRFEGIVSDNADRPILLHCSSGNRAGLLWAAHLIEQGIEVENALALVRPLVNRQETRDAIRNYVKGATR